MMVHKSKLLWIFKKEKPNIFLISLPAYLCLLPPQKTFARLNIKRNRGVQ